MAWEQLSTEGEIYEALHICLTPHDYAYRAPSDKKCAEYDTILTTVVCDDGTPRENHNSFEVKGDKMTCFTGNIPIEFRGYSGDSGITTTHADYWAHFVHNYSRLPGERYYYELPMEKLRQMIRDDKYKRIMSGGNGNYVSMYLFDEKTFNAYKKTYHTDDVPRELLERIFNIRPTYPAHIQSVRNLLRNTTGETHI